MTTLAWIAVGVLGWIALELVVVLVVGRVVYVMDARAKPDPATHAGELLDFEDVDWDFPRKDAA